MLSGWFGLSAGVPNFPYTIGDDVGTHATISGASWTMKSGKATEGEDPVTIFTMDLKNASEMCASVARNAMRRAKTLRLPGVLKCLESTEYKDTLYIATEPCRPLAEALRPEQRQELYEGDGDKFLEGTALGLHTLSSVLESMHRNGIAHHSVSVDSIMVLDSGEWRLFGFELAGSFEEEHSLYRKYRSALVEHRVPAGRGLDTVSSVDAWGLGCLIFEVFTCHGTSSDSQKQPDSLTHGDLRAPGKVPRKLHPTLTGLLASEAKMRWPMPKFLTDCALLKDSTYVQDLNMLNELSLKDATERDTFFRDLSRRVGDYPLQACKLLVLPKLNSAVQFGACSPSVLEPLMKIGSRLTNEDFAKHVGPSVVTLFASPEQLVRYRLLTTAQEYASLLPPDLVRDKIWSHFATGFTHKSPEIRELTVRALVHFAPTLSETLLASDVPRFIAQLQQDREGPIRTNSTICLCMIAQHLPQADRAKTLLNGFGRMLKDPFTPSRAAAVKSFNNSLSLFSEETMAKQILPNMAPLMIDPEPEVRKTAGKCVASMVQLVEKYAQTIPAPTAAEPTPPSTPTAATPTAAGATNASTPASDAPASSSRGWFGWGNSAAKTAPDAGADTSATAKPSALATGSGDMGDGEGAGAGAAGDARPSAPTAKASRTHHVDPAPTAAKAESGWSDDDDDDFSVPAAAPVVKTQPVSRPIARPSAAVGSSPGGATTKPAIGGAARAGGGMSLRKKPGLSGAVKKAD